MDLKLGNLNLERFRLGNIYSTYFSMTPREQTIALVAAAAVIVLIVVLPIAVASNRISRLEREAADGGRQLKDVMRAIESYDKKKAELTELQQMLSGGYDSSISTTLETIADSTGIKDRIDSLKEKAAIPSEFLDETSVDVRMKKITLQQFVDFLYAIEHQSDKMLRIKQLVVKPRFDNKQELDITFTVSTYRLLEGAAEGA